MPDDRDVIRAQMETMSDADVLAIWLAALDPEHPTPREEAALAIMEARNIDF